MTVEELLDGSRLTISVPETAALLGVSRNSAYEAARRGEIPVLEIGRRLVVPVARLLDLLGIEQATAVAGSSEEA